MITPTPFDAFLNGDETALNEMETAGLGLFVEKGCASCHSGVNVGGHGCFPFGLVEKTGADVLPVDDKGRFAVKKTVNDEYVFRAAAQHFSNGPLLPFW